MPVPRRSISSARDLRDIDKVLKDRQIPPKPAFTTLFHKRADITPAAAPPTPRSSQAAGNTSATLASPGPRTARAHSTTRNGNAIRSASNTIKSPHSSRTLGTPRTPAPASSLTANNNFALLVARDVSRQPENSEVLRHARIAEQYRLSVNRRYDMVVDEEEVIKGGTDPNDLSGGDITNNANTSIHSDDNNPSDDNIGNTDNGHGIAPVRRLIKPVSKVGLRSDYYVPHRKHTMASLKSSSVISAERVRALAQAKSPIGTSLRQRIANSNIATIVDFIGKGSPCLSTVALVNRAFAAAVDAKLQEEDVATSDEVNRSLRAAREAVKAIPKAFFNAIRSLRTSPPQRVMDALRLTMIAVENDATLATNPLFDGPSATIAFRSLIEDGPETLVKRLIALNPGSLLPEVVIAIRGNGREGNGVADLVDVVRAYNPHAGTLCEWVHSVVTVASPPQ